MITTQPPPAPPRADAAREALRIAERHRDRAVHHTARAEHHAAEARAHETAAMRLYARPKKAPLARSWIRAEAAAPEPGSNRAPPRASDRLYRGAR